MKKSHEITKSHNQNKKITEIKQQVTKFIKNHRNWKKDKNHNKIMKLEKIK